MQLFRITEPTDRPDPIAPGLDFEVDQDEPCVSIGGSPASGHFFLLPFGESLGRFALEAKRLGLPLVRADIVRKEGGELLLTREHDHHNQSAIVHLSTEAGEGGDLLLTANSHGEVVEDVQRGKHKQRRVMPKWHSFPPPGVEVLNTKHIEIGSEGICRWNVEGQEEVYGPPFVLLLMLAGSSFRVWRTGALEGAVPEFVVSWNGYDLRTVVPAKYRQRT